MTTTRIRKVTANSHRADLAWGLPRERHCWVVVWRSSQMPAPAFWYYGTRKRARETAKKLRSGS